MTAKVTLSFSDDTISEARAAAARNGVTGLLVADGERLAGIVTARDVRGEPDDRPVRRS